MPDYEKIKRLGNGAFGEVWLVEDRALGVNRAVKYVPPHKIKNPTNFYQEPQTLMALKHENIVTVTDAGTTDDGQLYIAMEYLPKGSISDFVKGGILPTRQAIKIICDVCRGIEYAHALDYVHRDIKPANILIANGLLGKISDFGLATKVDSFGVASPYGYWDHLAPEVLADDITNNLTDIYAIGVTLYRLVNGDAYLPMNLDKDELQDRIVAGTFPDRNYYRPFIPQNLRTIINKSMNVDPTERYQSASLLRRKLEQVNLLCDWMPHTIPNGTKWTASINDMEFIATHFSPKHGINHFIMEKGRVGKKKQRIINDCKENLKKAAIERHIHKTLYRISTTGK